MSESDFHLERLGSHDGNLARIILKHGCATVGRISTNDIVCNSLYVSRHHCVIEVTEKDEVKVKFQSTTNGIFINGRQKSDVNFEIFLKTNDIVGIGCDTSVDEINNENCFVFQLKRKVCEIISLIELDDDEEEESKALELYSQLNLEEMKQELMELDEFVEEYSRIKTEPDDVELLPNMVDIQTEYISDEQDVKGDIFENIISNSGTYAEKSKLINDLVPDVATLLKKDCSTIDCDGIFPVGTDDLPNKIEPVIKMRRVTVSLLKIDVSDALKSSTKKSFSGKKNKVDHIKTVNHIIPSTKDELPENSYRNIDSKNTESNKQVNVPIMNRRHSCYVPSLNQPVTKSSLKRKLEIIEAPHMLKRRKSISGTLNNYKRQHKKEEEKWMSKKPPKNQMKRSKEEKDEIKSKLAALAESKKEKVVEVKTVRITTKIPVKNTQKTRNDYLTDTLIKSTPTPSTSKIKRADTVHPPKTSNVRITEGKVTTNAVKISLRASMDECNTKILADNKPKSPSDEASTYDMNGNSSKLSFAATTTTIVKSILKKPNQIRKRRTTVSFSDDFRPKIDDTKTDSAEIHEENSDDVLTNIMSLGVSSLKKSSNSPPINGKNFNYKTVADQYDSLRHLQNVFIPLMKTELWKEIEDGYSRIRSQPPTHVQLNFYIQDEDHRNRYKYRCQTSSSSIVQVGSLILVSNIKYGKEFLGYICNRQIANQICFFEFVTPCAIQDASSYSRTELTMKSIMYIRPNLKVFDAIFKLKSSPLLQHILKPSHYCIEPPIRPFKYMGFKQAELDYLVACNIRNTKKMNQKIESLRKSICSMETTMKKGLYDESALLENADIICTTLNSCCSLSSKISSMDICIIDEATQCNEPTSLIPLQFNIRALVLVGDTNQLASTVVSEIAKQYNYDQSLFQRLQKSCENVSRNAISQLNIQYRMHPDILHWPNEYFYKNRLVSANCTKTHAFNLKPYTILDLNFEQSTYSGQKHISNIDEAKFIRHLLDFLITKVDPKTNSYGIISAYSQQKDDLARNLGLTYPFVTVNTIDSCQGQERDIVIISIARSRGIGFLAIRQRLNVALTRARKMLIVCGNFNMLQRHSMWNKLIDDARQRHMYVHFPKIDDHLYHSYFEKYLIK